MPKRLETAALESVFNGTLVLQDILGGKVFGMHSKLYSILKRVVMYIRILKAQIKSTIKKPALLSFIQCFSNLFICLREKSYLFLIIHGTRAPYNSVLTC